MLLGILVLGASLVLDWNEGVSHYESGDVTNALKVLRPLMLTKEYGPRAAEIVAKLELERGEIEEAAAAAQIALRAHPKDERHKRNFARAASNLSEFNTNHHIEEVLNNAQGKDPSELLRASWYVCRDLIVEAGNLSTNDAANQVRLSTDLSARAEKLVDNWIPVREAVTHSITNDAEAATIIARLEEAKLRTESAAVKLADLETGDAYVKLGEVEEDFKSFVKLVAMPPMSIEEDYIAETNKNFKDALDFTRAFRAKFPLWAKNYQSQAESNTNAAPFTVETQTKISGLATELEQLQMDMTENERKLEIINEIRELMPKNPSSGQGQGEGQGDGQAQGEVQSEGEEQDQEEDQDKGAGKDEEKEDSSAEAVLQKAEERSKEYEDKKRRNERRVKLAPNERDW